MEGSDRINVEIVQDGKGKLEASVAPEEDFEIVIKKDGYFLFMTSLSVQKV